MKTLLRIVLIVVGLLTLVFSLAGIFVPWQNIVAWMSTWNVTLPAAPDSPITVYMFRAMSVTYAWAGFLFLLAAADPPKYLALIRTLALALVCVGLACILVGVKVGLPMKPVLFCDGIPCLVAGVLIWTLSIPLGRQPAQAVPPTQSTA